MCCPFLLLASCVPARVFLCWEREGHWRCLIWQPKGSNWLLFAFVRLCFMLACVRSGRVAPNWWILGCCPSWLPFSSRFWPSLYPCWCGILSNNSHLAWPKRAHTIISLPCGCSNMRYQDLPPLLCLSHGRLPLDVMPRRSIVLPIGFAWGIHVFSHRFCPRLPPNCWACIWWILIYTGSHPTKLLIYIMTVLSPNSSLLLNLSHSTYRNLGMPFRIWAQWLV